MNSATQSLIRFTALARIGLINLYAHFRCTFKVDVVMYRGKFSAPFKADFKLGFSPNFDFGSESW